MAIKSTCDFYLGLLYDHNPFQVKHAPYHILYDSLSKDQKGICWFFILSILKKKFPAFLEQMIARACTVQGRVKNACTLYSRKWSPLQSLFILKRVLNSACRLRKLISYFKLPSFLTYITVVFLLLSFMIFFFQHLEFEGI